jgi:hypothetical protein
MFSAGKGGGEEKLIICNQFMRKRIGDGKMNEIRIEFVLNLYQFGLVLVCLLAGGYVYNRVVDWLGNRHEGYTSLLVCVGTGFTLAGVAVISWQAALVVFLSFVASGFPMVIGEAVRFAKLRHDGANQATMAALDEAGEVINGKRSGQ